MFKHSFVAIAVCSLAGVAMAQCQPDVNRFCVTFNGSSYSLNSQARPVIELVRGETYTFQMVNLTGAHPFHISTSATGGGAGAGHWSDGVTPAASAVSGNQTLTFTVPHDAPNTLFYQCFVHAGLGGRIDIVNPHCHADFNGDGFLDGFDYDEFVQCFEGGTCPSGRTADFNEDGFADGFDYDEFVAAFEMGCG